jgi:DNA (cytosine-5)-methyltransferase 1
VRALSLYSGIGGMDLGAHIAGIETVGFCEADAFCRGVLRRHWPDVPIWESDEDVTVKSVRERTGGGGVDLVFGGPPCQPFSVAGKREGTVDPRHRWPQMARIVGELRPAWVVVENVAGFGDVAEQLVRPALERLGYETVRFDVPAAGVGAPHRRERIFVVAYAGGGGLHRGEERDMCEAGGVEAQPRNDDDGRDSRGGVRADGADQTGIGGFALAYADDAGRGERCGAESVGSEQRSAECRCGEAVGDTELPRREEHQRLASRAERRPASGSRPAGDGRLESRLGGVADGVASWLDALQWPVPRGCDQADYEPPRVTTEKHERRKRLKALGNAVVPVQVLPIFALIRAIEEES